MLRSDTSKGELDSCEVLNVYVVGMLVFVLCCFFLEKSVQNGILVFVVFKSCPDF